MICGVLQDREEDYFEGEEIIYTLDLGRESDECPSRRGLQAVNA